MSESDDLTGHPRGPANPRGPATGWGPLVALALLAAGLLVTFKLAATLIYDPEGYQPGAADCDDCGITLLLDNLGWLGLALGAYLGIACLGYLAFRRTRRTT